ncbi:MAG: putative OB-fold protein [Natronomonas sp.]|jgi:uncharacterized OB-fold protein
MNDLMDLAAVVLDRQAAAYDKPLPELTDESYARPFWEGLQDEQLLLQQCPDCEHVQYFSRPWCGACGEPDLEWIEAEGTGTVQSYAVPRRNVANPTFEDDMPYLTGYVDLDEGVRMYSNIIDCEVDDVERGMDVEVVFDHSPETLTLPKFRPL